MSEEQVRITVERICLQGKETLEVIQSDMESVRYRVLGLDGAVEIRDYRSTGLRALEAAYTQQGYATFPSDFDSPALVTIHKYKVSNGSPGAMSATFPTGNTPGGGGLSINNGPRIYNVRHQNQQVHGALVALTNKFSLFTLRLRGDQCVTCSQCDRACPMDVPVMANAATERAINRDTECIECLACEAVCPTGAIQKRFEDGAVLVDPNKCIGCHTCLITCPFGVPQFGSDGRMQKCDLCVDRISRGTEPMCVATCPSEALHFGPMRELTKHSMKRSAQKNHRILFICLEP